MSIGSATNLSSCLDTEGYRVASILWSTGTTANAPMTFLGGNNSATLYNLWDDTGNECVISSAAFSTADKRSIAIGPTLAVQLGAHRYIQFRRGNSTAGTSAGATAYPFDVVLTPW